MIHLEFDVCCCRQAADIVDFLRFGNWEKNEIVGNDSVIMIEFSVGLDHESRTTHSNQLRQNS